MRGTWPSGNTMQAGNVVLAGACLREADHCPAMQPLDRAIANASRDAQKAQNACFLGEPHIRISKEGWVGGFKHERHEGKDCA